MTTIAYNHKDKQVAVDSRFTRGDTIVTDDGVKMHAIGDDLIFMCGNLADMQLFLKQYDSKEFSDNLDVGGIIIKSGIAHGFHVPNGLEEWGLSYSTAMGSGSDHAITAMDLGCSAKKAVKMAALRDTCTGGKIRVYKVE